MRKAEKSNCNLEVMYRKGGYMKVIEMRRDGILT
jgi:hypothetical protein